MQDTLILFQTLGVSKIGLRKLYDYLILSTLDVTSIYVWDFLVGFVPSKSYTHICIHVRALSHQHDTLSLVLV